MGTLSPWSRVPWVGARGLGAVPDVPLVPVQDGSLQCPTCKAIYGEKTGTQPPGKMEFHLIPHSLPGYTDSKTIRIVYDIPTGIQVRNLRLPPQGPHAGVGVPTLCHLLTLLSSHPGPGAPQSWQEVHGTRLPAALLPARQ